MTTTYTSINNNKIVITEDHYNRLGPEVQKLYEPSLPLASPAVSKIKIYARLDRKQHGYETWILSDGTYTMPYKVEYKENALRRFVKEYYSSKAKLRNFELIVID